MDQPQVKSKGKQRGHFFAQFGTNIVAAVGLLGFSLTVGTWGYHHYAGMAWIDAFANAAMMVTSMGPLDPLTMSR